MTCIYYLRCPVGESVRYIGKADEPSKRLKHHLRDAVTGKLKYHHGNWIRGLLKRGEIPQLTTLFVVPQSMRWQDAERFFISSALSFGFSLTNSTRGGEGLSFIDDEAKARLIYALKSAHARPEVKERHAIAFADPIVRERLSLAQREINARPGMREQKSMRCKASHNTEKVIAKNSSASKEKWTDPQYRARISAATKAYWANEETRAIRTSQLKAAWVRRKQTKENLIP